MLYLSTSFKAIITMAMISPLIGVTAEDGASSQSRSWLNLTDEQTEQFILKEKVITDNSLSIDNENYLTSKIKVRLNLTDEQTEQVKPIFLDHIEKRLGVLKKYGINRESQSYDKKMGFRELRAIKKEMDEINKQAENQIAAVLSKEQIDEYKRIQVEQRIEMRARLKNGNTWKE